MQIARRLVDLLSAPGTGAVHYRCDDCGVVPDPGTDGCPDCGGELTYHHGYAYWDPWM